MRRIACIFCSLMLSVLVVAAQQQPNATPAPASSAQGPQQPIRVTTQMVVEEVTVKDKNGKPIEGLTANDFSLTEDGVPQTLSFVEFQQLQPASNSAEPAPSGGPVVPTAPPPTQVQIAPELPGDTRYR